MQLADWMIKLSELNGPSGFEEPVSHVVQEALRQFMDAVSVDTMGNVIGLRRCGRENAKKLLLDAHLDEIGMIVTKADHGFLRFADIGGVDPRMLPAREVFVLAEPPVTGVITCMPPHALASEDMDKAFSRDDLLIDVGMGEEEAKEKIQPGTPVVFRGGAGRLGKDRVCGKALDDRACFAVILRSLELLKDEELGADLYVMGSVQEEVGLRGAKTGAFAIDPDICVAVDVTHALTPDAPKEVTGKLGEGAVVSVGPNMNKKLSDQLVKLCKEKEIKYQVEACAGATGTNGWVMSVSRAGIPTAELALPLRYMHSPVEVVDLRDGEAVAGLLSEFVRRIGEVL